MYVWHWRIYNNKLLWWGTAAAAAAKTLQLCPTLCDPIDGSPWGSPVPGILQARTLEWVVISFSNAWMWKVKMLSRIRLFATPWTAAYQAPPSMGFSRQEYWSGLPLPSPWWGTTTYLFERLKLKKQTLTISSAEKDSEQLELPIHCWWEWKMDQPLQKMIWQFLIH